MATKAKDSSVVGKEKKGPTLDSPLTNTKRTTKPPSPSRSTDKATSNPTEKQVPNYLRPTISSKLESHSQSFKLPKSTTDATNKATLNRRRSFDKPPSPSRLPKQTQASPSRSHKDLVSPARSLSLRSSHVPVKTISTWKPVSEKNSKTPNKEGKTQPLNNNTKSVKKRSPSPSPSTTKKVTDDASATKTSAETTEPINVVETEPEVKEAINDEVEEVEKVENQEHEVEKVDSEHENKQELDESAQPHIQDDNEKVIPTASEEEAKEEPQEEKIEDEHKENEDINQDECKINGSQSEINHSTAEEEVEVKEKEEEEGGVVIEEDHKNEEVEVEEKEGIEGVKLTEGQDEEHEHIVETEVKEAKSESTKAKQETASGVKGKKESQVSNDVIEETASKLLEERKNKVRALAGAFQTVIDYQTK